MASPDESKRKILKAKKTMPVSCRKQVEILNKSRNVEALKTATIENNIPSGNENSSTAVISSKCRHSENDASSLNSIKNSVCEPKSKEFSQNLIKPLEITDSETRLEYTEEQVVYPYEKPSKTVEFPRKLFIHEAKDSQNTTENHFECQASVTRSFFEHEEDCNLKSICHLSSVLSGIVQIPKSTKTNTLDDKRIDKIVSYLEANSSAELYDKKQSDILIFSSDDPFVPADKIPKLVNSVISSNCADDILKSEESYRNCLSSILSCENLDAKWLSSPDTDSNNSHNQKKRMFSENKENVKRVKTSEQINENISVALEKQTALLEQAKIAKLERRVEAVLLPQRHCVEPNVVSNNTACKVPNSETMILDKNPESVNSPQERKTVKSETCNPSEKSSGKINWSLDHNEAVSERNQEAGKLQSMGKLQNFEILKKNSLKKCTIKHLLISWLQSPSAVIWGPKRIKPVTVSIALQFLYILCHKGGVICISEVIDTSHAILIPACAPSSPASHMMCSTYNFPVSLHCSVSKAFLSLPVILWSSAFRWVYFSFSPLPFASLFFFFSAVCKVSSDNHFALLHFFLGDGFDHHLL
ncbi:hypothetical protein FD754_017387 [Muntiacus muntjak]|uniref:ATF7-interacting protein protein binding domain-containing protein n=1 Tax=Muntiacus muntjak TaxID=9888 RepID=A0A5N3VT87_MUNMU|nr:hypothetical protein FD754_017387 [Muntiacus muntjak]